MSLPHSIHVVSPPAGGSTSSAKMRDKETLEPPISAACLREIGLLLGYDATKGPAAGREEDRDGRSPRWDAPLLDGKKAGDRCRSCAPGPRASPEGLLDLMPLGAHGPCRPVPRYPRTLQAGRVLLQDFPADISDRDGPGVRSHAGDGRIRRSRLWIVEGVGRQAAKIQSASWAPSKARRAPSPRFTPTCRCFAAAIDAKLNDHGYIVSRTWAMQATACSAPSSGEKSSHEHGS